MPNHPTLAAALVTIAVIAPAGWYVLDADIQTDGKRLRPLQQSFTVDGTRITLDVDRHVVMTGDTVTATVVAFNETAQPVTVDLWALHSSNYEGARVEQPWTPIDREVLKLTAMDVDDQKLSIKNPKSGKSAEVVFIPKKLAERLKDYLKARGAEGSQRIFPITYTAARVMVKKAGALVGVHLRPHDLRRHAATFASRSGVPLEIVSKVILRHANLSTTQRYLGKVSDVEAVRWIENLYG